VIDFRRLRLVEEENRKLNRLVAELVAWLPYPGRNVVEIHHGTEGHVLPVQNHIDEKPDALPRRCGSGSVSAHVRILARR
jgi:hypothetical protein